MECVRRVRRWLHVAVPRSPDRVDHLRDTKRPFRRAKPHAIADAEREPDADRHYRVEYRRSLPRQPASQPGAPGW